jgi:deoxyribodipyrimidine photo-lyase
MQQKISIHWFRRDLRLFDNAALYNALSSGLPVLPVFIFDSHILSALSSKVDIRVNFIYNEILELKKKLEQSGSSLQIIYGKPEDIFPSLLTVYSIESVYANQDYEPYAIARDEKIRSILQAAGVWFYTFKDQVVYEKSEVIKPDGKPYTVFTPYSKKWLERFSADQRIYFPSEELTDNFMKCDPCQIVPLNEIGFKAVTHKFPSEKIMEDTLCNYNQYRDMPALDRTSHLGIHIRFGTVSIRQLAYMAEKLSAVWLNELIWREFFMQILFHFPYVAQSAFKPQYDRISWKNDEGDFQKWCEGNTGYPLVDAGMKELNQTGFMHNRVRMVTASFLTKHLLIDWRWGEAWFAGKLLDFELSSNNGNWQWAAGTGCDAAPYFRIFNPSSQAAKFDPGAAYIKRWVPEYGTSAYPRPMVDHNFARNRCLSVYKNALSN